MTKALFAGLQAALHDLITCMAGEGQLKEVTIFTDGGCDPNPGSGGYGVILISGNTRKELIGGFRLTTNNRMELFAAIAGLQALKFPCKVKLLSDQGLGSKMAKKWLVAE